MSIRKVGTTAFAIVVLLLAVFGATMKANSGINPFATATTVLAVTIAIAIVCTGAEEIVSSKRIKKIFLASGSCVTAIGFGFGVGVVYTLQVALHTPHVLTDYMQELTLPALVNIVFAFGLAIRAGLVKQSARTSESARVDPRSSKDHLVSA